MPSEDLPDDLEKCIEWEKTNSIEREAHLRSLPKDLRVEAKRNLYLYSLENVSIYNAKSLGVSLVVSHSFFNM